MQLPDLTEGRLLRRYKRFLADIELADGSVVVAHCPNPGSMKTCQPEHGRVWISHSTNPKRKLAFTWELVMAEGSMTLVNTHRANPIVEEALHANRIRELRDFDSLRREVPYGESSRIDFLLSWGEQRTYLEVKNVTMADGPGRAMFPDSITARGTKHLRELMAMVEEGHTAVLLFCCSRAGTKGIRPADEIDPLYGKTLREAAQAGVQILAYGCELDTQQVIMGRALPIDLSC